MMSFVCWRGSKELDDYEEGSRAKSDSHTIKKSAMNAHPMLGEKAWRGLQFTRPYARRRFQNSERNLKIATRRYEGNIQRKAETRR